MTHIKVSAVKRSLWFKDSSVLNYWTGQVAVYHDSKRLYTKSTGIKRLSRTDALSDADKLRDTL